MVTTDNLVSYYSLEENAANTTVADSHGSNTGTASTNTSNLSIPGKVNDAFDFDDASSEFVGLGSYSQMNYPLTINAWFKYDTTKSQYIITSTKSGIINFGLRLTTGNKLRYESYVQGSVFVFDLGDTTLSTGTWYMATLTVTTTEAKCYLNASIDRTNVATGDQALTGTGLTRSIGASEFSSNDYFDGIIDEVSIWARELTQQDITDLYNSGNGLAYPFTGATVRLIKIAGTFVEKPILTKVGGTFVDKPIKIKVGGTFQDA